MKTQRPVKTAGYNFSTQRARRAQRSSEATQRNEDYARLTVQQKSARNAAWKAAHSV